MNPTAARTSDQPPTRAAVRAFSIGTALIAGSGPEGSPMVTPPHARRESRGGRTACATGALRAARNRIPRHPRTPVHDIRTVLAHGCRNVHPAAYDGGTRRAV